MHCRSKILTLSKMLVPNCGLADEPSAVNVARIPPRPDKVALFLEVSAMIVVLCHH